MTSQKTVKTRLYIVSDTHNKGPWPAKATQYAYRAPLPPADVLLHAGDITMTGRITEYEGMLEALKEADAQLKIVIAGNHDITHDEDYYKYFGVRLHRHGLEDLEKVRELWTGDEARKAGIVYLEEGVRTFTLKNGARFTIYTSPYTPEFCMWAFPYNRDQDRYNPAPATAKFKAPNPVPSWPQVDLMLTHGPPYKVLDQTNRGEYVGCKNLLQAVARCRPRLHCFGHIHEAWGAERVHWTDNSKHCVQVDKQQMLADRSVHLDLSKDGGDALKFGEETVFVNASIMNVSYRPENAPWLLDLDLPLAESSKP